jgi:hypothetical protein
MATPRFDRARIQGFLELCGDRLEGEWLLVGGGAAAAWFAPARTTEDIALIGLGGTQAERFALMDLAAAAQLPIEAVNSAADFFVRRIADWREHLVALHRGARATIYRPDATLFLLLKIQRLSEIDLEDCTALIERGDPIDRDRVRRAIEALAATSDLAATARRSDLLARLG